MLAGVVGSLCGSGAMASYLDHADGDIDGDADQALSEAELEPPTTVAHKATPDAALTDRFYNVAHTRCVELHKGACWLARLGWGAPCKRGVSVSTRS